MGADGAFKRTESVWRNWVSREIDSKFQPEKDRYHLYVAHACPWAHRTLIARSLKGLEDVISVTAVMPVWRKTKPGDSNDTHCGWMFADEGGKFHKNTIGLGGPFPSSCPENKPDPHFGAKTVREIYEQVGDTEGKYTVPILFDKKLRTIVSNESSEIIQMLNTEFDDLAKFPEVDLEPEDLVDKMKEVDQWIYPDINNGVYRCGFAKSQKAYDKAIDDLTEAFDRLEETLKSQRFIAGDRLTLSDIRLFVTLIRFDEVYVVYFKTNTRSVANSPTLLNYCRDIYSHPGVAETVNMDQIKGHYFCSHPDLNKHSIIPKGPNFEKLLQQPHDRDSFDVFKKRRVDSVTSNESISESN
ncbi:hypothetical protein ACHAXR_006305 [Thalassiosira sp. AJA248-18]